MSLVDSSAFAKTATVWPRLRAWPPGRLASLSPGWCC